MINDAASTIGKKVDSKFEIGEKLPRSEYDFKREVVVNFGFCTT
jgi:hypothetical protein